MKLLKIDETTREIVIFTHNSKSQTSAKEADSKKVARVRAWRLELFELFLPEQERTEHQQFWIINSETWKAFLTALAISNAPENDEKRR